MKKMGCPYCDGPMRFVKRTVRVPYGTGERATVLTVRGCIHSLCRGCGAELSSPINELVHTRAVYQYIKRRYGKAVAKRFRGGNTWRLRPNALGTYSKRPGYKPPSHQR